MTADGPRHNCRIEHSREVDYRKEASACICEYGDRLARIGTLVGGDRMRIKAIHEAANATRHPVLDRRSATTGRSGKHNRRDRVAAEFPCDDTGVGFLCD